ncbi:hypothetical protein [Moorena sp. SIO3H5]|uniref:hypothetical protein n=1 Tax=Moorena sp. SIO3H5 TaxID=2607834 RepID=UPI0013B68D7B|nr:hypothetical protein [Moorena sp. SIO3H5]NEO70964.1 hypothetical protein [Moorena sp. SIO3H5]
MLRTIALQIRECYRAGQVIKVDQRCSGLTGVSQLAFCMADKVRYLDQALDQDISITIKPHHPILSSPHYQLI